MSERLVHQEFRVVDYDLAATLESGQAFRWEGSRDAGVWEGVVGGRWVRLADKPGSIRATTLGDSGDWGWLCRYLQADVELGAVLREFPPDAVLQDAVATFRGLRLLRQDPWECLASFLLSSTKQIVQIRQGIAELAARFGEPVAVPEGSAAAFAFPTAAALAAATEAELRACRIGFRARYLSRVSEAVATGACRLDEIGVLPLGAARERLMTLPGVGRKIADCVLLFGYGFAEAFPVDVWVLRALRELYFAGRRPTSGRLLAFAETHFGPQGGYAQQYLFHWMRWKAGRVDRGRGGGSGEPSDAGRNGGRDVEEGAGRQWSGSGDGDRRRLWKSK